MFQSLRLCCEIAELLLLRRMAYRRAAVITFPHLQFFFLSFSVQQEALFAIEGIYGIAR